MVPKLIDHICVDISNTRIIDVYDHLIESLGSIIPERLLDSSPIRMAADFGLVDDVSSLDLDSEEKALDRSTSLRLLCDIDLRIDIDPGSSLYIRHGHAPSVAPKMSRIPILSTVSRGVDETECVGGPAM